jgi:uncharacterized protein YecT (DUF1311 family)
MKDLFIFALVLFASFSCSAQSHEVSGPCWDNAGTQLGMDKCANQDAKSADAELNSVYTSLLTKAQREAGAIKKIKIAERAWIAYRNVYIDATYPASDKQAEYGSAYSMEADLLYASLTRQHIVALRELEKHYA